MEGNGLLMEGEALGSVTVGVGDPFLHPGGIFEVCFVLGLSGKAGFQWVLSRTFVASDDVHYHAPSFSEEACLAKLVAVLVGLPDFSLAVVVAGKEGISYDGGMHCFTRVGMVGENYLPLMFNC